MHQILVKEEYANRVPNVTYFRGNKWQCGEYLTHDRHGHWITWHPNGYKASEGRYDHGKRLGLWVFWSDTGHKICEIDFSSQANVDSLELGIDAG